MGIHKNRGVNRPRVGETIAIESPLGLPPSGVYKVDGYEGPYILLSAGEFRMCVRSDFVKIVNRHLPDPPSWIECEMEILERQSRDCEECRKLLEQKRDILKLNTIN